MADIEIANAGTFGQREGRVADVIWLNREVGYAVLVPNTTAGVQVFKTDDSGATWAEQDAGNRDTDSSVKNIDVWWDRWTRGDDGTVIHIATAKDHASREFAYQAFDTATDTYAARVTLLASLGAPSDGRDTTCAITKLRSGRLRAIAIRQNTTIAHYESTDGVTWNSDTLPAFAAIDMALWLTPFASADDEDMMALVCGGLSGNTIRVWTWDDSAGVWALEATTPDGSYNSVQHCEYYISPTSRFSDDAVYFGHFPQYDAAGNDGKVHLVTGDVGAIVVSALTEIFSNIADSYCPAVWIDQETEDLYVPYFGKIDGSEAVGSAVTVNYVKSTDAGVTWEAEVALQENAAGDVRGVRSGRMLRSGDSGRFMPVWYHEGTGRAMTSLANSIEFAGVVAGGANRIPNIPVISSIPSISSGRRRR
jgi:hypothetical protein